MQPEYVNPLQTDLKAGCREDQISNYLSAGIILNPRHLEAAAPALLCDRLEGPVEVGYCGARGRGKPYWVLAQIAVDDCQRRWLTQRCAPGIIAMPGRHGLAIRGPSDSVAGGDVFRTGIEGGTIAADYQKHGSRLEPANDDRINGAAKFLSRPTAGYHRRHVGHSNTETVRPLLTFWPHIIARFTLLPKGVRGRFKGVMRRFWVVATT